MPAASLPAPCTDVEHRYDKACIQLILNRAALQLTSVVETCLWAALMSMIRHVVRELIYIDIAILLENY